MGSGIDNFSVFQAWGGFSHHRSFGTGCRNIEQYPWDDLRPFQFPKKGEIFFSRQQFALSQAL